MQNHEQIENNVAKALSFINAALQPASHEFENKTSDISPPKVLLLIVMHTG